MMIPRPDHLLDQAERLSSSLPALRRQTELRRATSTAYYAVFHQVMTALADEIVGRTHRHQPRYALVYRSPDHRTLRTVCVEATRPSPSPKFAAYLPASGFASGLRRFAGSVVDLQELRHGADYNPVINIARSDATGAVRAARSAISDFKAADAQERRLFLTLLLCPPR